MVEIFDKLHRLYRKTAKKKETLRIKNAEEPLIISRTRMKFLELEIDTLAYILSKEVRTNLPLSSLSGITWTDISMEDLDKLEKVLSDRKYNSDVSPIVEPLISILKGLLDTHSKFYNGKVMPYYVKLESESIQNIYLFKEELLYSFKDISERPRRHSELKYSENNNFSNTTSGTRTPRNSTFLNQKKIELPINGRNSSNTNTSTPKNTYSVQTPRSKYESRFGNFDAHISTPKGGNKKNFNSRNEVNTPRKNLRGKLGMNYGNVNSQDGSILAAKALLGLSVNMPVTEQEIRKAYLKAAMRWHPDKSNINSDEKSHICFTAIQNAMELLLNNISKEREI